VRAWHLDGVRVDATLQQTLALGTANAQLLWQIVLLNVNSTGFLRRSHAYKDREVACVAGRQPPCQCHNAHMATDVESLVSPFTAGQGGVMTDDVGVITGKLELTTTLNDRLEITVQVRYQGADEWYRITAADTSVHEPADHRSVHHALLGILNRPEG
jgi:hypothetical protein